VEENIKNMKSACKNKKISNEQ